jgi:transcriptional regulator with XRE-family HTH domain
VATKRILGRGLRKDRKLPLRALREAADKTQEEIASLAGMDQSEISRIEQRDDLRLSTLRRYAHALDAEIEIIAVLPTGHRIKVDL